MGGKVSTHTGKVCSCFLHIFLVDGNGDIFLLHDAVCAGGFFKQHLVILTAVLIQFITHHGQEYGFFKVLTVHTAVVNSDLCGSSAIQTVEQFGVGQKHGFFVLTGCHKIVDVGEFECLCKLVPDHKNTVLPDAANGNYILHLTRDGVFFFIQLE